MSEETKQWAKKVEETFRLSAEEAAELHQQSIGIGDQELSRKIKERINEQ